VFVAVDVPGADRVSIRLRASAPAPGDPDDAAFAVLGFALAESYTSRLYRELVTARGLAYDVHGARVESRVDPLYTLEVSVPRDRVGEAVDVIEAAIAELASVGPTHGDAVGAHAAAVRRWNEAFASASSAADFYEPLVVLGLGVAGARARLDALAVVSPSDVARAAQVWLGPDRRRWVLAGERDAIEAGLPGRPIVWQRQ
jgi:predicted Zn-dependent peptidase